MAIARRTPKKSVERPAPRVRTTIESATIVDVDTKIAKMVSYIEGHSWSVNYYNQIKAKEDSNTPLDPYSPETLQQYKLIRNYTIKVESPIENVNSNDVEGSGLVLYGVIPQENDVIEATLLNGRRALFRITEVNRKTYNLTDVYEVTFKVLAFYDTNKSYFAALEHRVVERFYFDKESVLLESSPFIEEEDFVIRDRFNKHIDRLTRLYLGKFINDSGVLCIDNTIDPLLVDFVHSALDRDILNEFGLTPIPDLDANIDNEDSIFDIITGRDPSGLNYIKKTFIKTSGGGYNSLFRKLGYYGITSIIKLSDEGLPYIFSENFYKGDTGITEMEKMVLDLIHDRSIETKKIEDTISVVLSESDNEQYYLIPILVTLLRVGVVSLQSNLTIQT
jgi:hypothetical protein